MGRGPQAGGPAPAPWRLPGAAPAGKGALARREQLLARRIEELRPPRRPGRALARAPLGTLAAGSRRRTLAAAERGRPLEQTGQAARAARGGGTMDGGDLVGRRVLVVGSSAGIGRVVGLRL